MARNEARRDDILAAAAKLFAANGYHETTVQEIAEYAGIQKATLYSYASSKESLLGELMEEMLTLPLAVARSIVEQPISPREKLRSFVFKYVAIVTDRQELVKIFFHERRRLPPEYREPLMAAAKELEGYVDQIIREGQEQGSFRTIDPRVLRQSLFGMINWMTEWYRKDGRLCPLTIADEMVEMLLRGWAKPICSEKEE